MACESWPRSLNDFAHLRSGREKQPKHKVFGRDILRTSGRIFGRKSRPKAFTQGKKKHIHINKFAGLSRDWVGAKKLFMCFFQVIPYGREKTHKPNPPKQSRDNPVKILFTCFFLYVFFCSQFTPSLGAQEHKVVCADVLDPKLRTSMTRGGVRKTLCRRISG